MALTLSFLGAAGTVTGSRHLLGLDSQRILVDCGLFQGLKQLRLRNWAPFPVPPGSLASVLLTHAHLDHTGYLPALVRDGFGARIHCSDATEDLCRILLPDSGHLQEQDAEFANRHGFSKHKPALPLYGVADAERALTHFSGLPFDQEKEMWPAVPGSGCAMPGIFSGPPSSRSPGAASAWSSPAISGAMTIPSSPIPRRSR